MRRLKLGMGENDPTQHRRGTACRAPTIIPPATADQSDYRELMAGLSSSS
ncbi:MAG: hypothetical protein ACE5EA_09595 [Nitrospirota bacterium]